MSGKETPKLLKPLVVRRMADGELAAFVGDDRVDGVIKIDTWCDESGSFTAVVLENACVHFDTESLPLGRLN